MEFDKNPLKTVTSIVLIGQLKKWAWRDETLTTKHEVGKNTGKF